MSRVSFEEFKKKALQNKEIMEEYEALKPFFDLKKRFVAKRIEKGLTQEQIAKMIRTSKSSVSRFESLNNTYLPNLRTLMKYAKALDCSIEIGLIEKTLEKRTSG